MRCAAFGICPHFFVIFGFIGSLLLILSVHPMTEAAAILPLEIFERFGAPALHLQPPVVTSDRVFAFSWPFFCFCLITPPPPGHHEGQVLMRNLFGESPRNMGGTGSWASSCVWCCGVRMG